MRAETNQQSPRGETGGRDAFISEGRGGKRKVHALKGKEGEMEEWRGEKERRMEKKSTI